MKEKNGFTLIEALAVIVILGLIMLIAVPAVTKYIFRSDKAVYASNISAYIETIRAKYEMKDYGGYLKSDEIMVVPIRHIILEKGDNQNTPYGEYDFDRSYVIIIPERNGYAYYATVIDSEKVGAIERASNEIGEDVIEENITRSLPSINAFATANAIFSFKNKQYKRSDVREVEGEDVNIGDNVYVFKKNYHFTTREDTSFFPSNSYYFECNENRLGDNYTTYSVNDFVYAFYVSNGNMSSPQNCPVCNSGTSFTCSASSLGNSYKICGGCRKEGNKYYKTVTNYQCKKKYRITIHTCTY